MGTGQAYETKNVILKKQTNPEFIVSDMRVIRFTLIFHCSALSQIISDIPVMNPTGHAQATHHGP